MVKDAYYFTHDANARHDPKIRALMAIYGLEGYARFFMILEILREHRGYKYPLNNKHAWASLAAELKLDEQQTRQFVIDCVGEFDLFCINEDLLYSESLINRMVKLDAKRERAINAVNIRWENHRAKQKKHDLFGDESGDVDISVPAEEVKESEKKPRKKRENGIYVLSDEKLFAEFMDELLKDEEFYRIPKKAMTKERNACLDWLKQKGKVYKDYKAFFRNWLRKMNQPEEKQNDKMVY